MEKDSKRAIRRHHYRRLKRKVRWCYGGMHVNGHYVPWDDEANKYRANVLGFMVNTRPVCSCSSCGNPRRHFKQISKQEYCAQLDYVEQCDDAGYVSTKQLVKRFKTW